MEQVLRINEAIGYAATQGKKVKPMDIAAKLWPDSAPKVQNQNIYNLMSGHTTRIQKEWVDVIVEMCGVDANYLFNSKPHE